MYIDVIIANNWSRLAVTGAKVLTRHQIKTSLDDWTEWQKSVATSAISRSKLLHWPQGMALALIGVRRCGKTFLSLEVARSRYKHILYFNCEDPIVTLFNDVRIFDEIISVFSEQFGGPPDCIIFDEIQNVTNWERWVRKTVDTNRWPLIVTGSSAKLLSSEISTSIAGRCIEHRVWPLSYREFLQFNKIADPSALAHLAAMQNYMKWGGFPAAVLEKEPILRKIILDQYMNDILLKDVAERHQIRSMPMLSQLLVYAYSNISSDFSYNAVQRAFGINTATVQDYCGFLNDAFVLFEVCRFHRNLKVQARDTKKIYAIDPGLRRTRSRSPSEDSGKVAENLVYIELRRRGQTIYYYKNRGEVDFLTTDESGKPLQAIQVCYSNMESPETYRREVDSLWECLEDLKLEEGLLLSLSREEVIKKRGMSIRIVPLYKFLMTDDIAPLN
jgi:predicted AAA+ superfamily ATPase